MEGKAFLGVLALIIVVLLLSFYWFIPYNTIELGSSSNSNFSLNSQEEIELQFYPNMRFSYPNISYKIENCPLQRKNDMEWAFDIIEEETLLNFYPVQSDAQVRVTCSDEVVSSEEGFYDAGYGGPTGPIVSGDFNIIEYGNITLMNYKECERPNVAIHELLHVLGFAHSENPKNIMYPISDCSQTLGEDTIEFINKIYSIPSQPDLLFENATASMHGKYLDVNFSVRNNGIIDSEEAVVKIFADDKEVKEVKIPGLEIGYGRRISMSNLWIKQINIEQIEFIIESNFKELDKENNQVIFEIKK